MDLLVAWFLILVINEQDHPVLRGPYIALTDCLAEKQYFEDLGHVTGGCSEMTVPQDTDTREFNGEPYLPVDRRLGGT